MSAPRQEPKVKQTPPQDSADAKFCIPAEVSPVSPKKSFSPPKGEFSGTRKGVGSTSRVREDSHHLKIFIACWPEDFHEWANGVAARFTYFIVSRDEEALTVTFRKHPRSSISVCQPHIVAHILKKLNDQGVPVFKAEMTDGVVRGACVRRNPQSAVLYAPRSALLRLLLRSRRHSLRASALAHRADSTLSRKRVPTKEPKESLIIRFLYGNKRF